MEENIGFEGDCKKMKKWEGKVSAKLKTPTADEVFQLLNDFFNIHKYFPIITTSYGIHGVSGQPGCIRYCASSRIPPSSSSSSIDEQKQQVVVNWCKERLMGVDTVQRSFSYEIVDGNIIGFNSYVSTMKVLMPSEDDEGGSSSNTGTGGCVMEWSFELEPMEGWKLEDLVSSYESGLRNMAHKIEDSLSMAG